jgi:hypothetical protein
MRLTYGDTSRVLSVMCRVSSNGSVSRIVYPAFSIVFTMSSAMRCGPAFRKAPARRLAIVL